MNRHLIGVTTPDYVKKAGRWVQSVPLVQSCRPRLVLLDFTPATDPDGTIEGRLRDFLGVWVDLARLPMPATHSFGMIQHGVFLDAFPDIRPDDLVCLTDLDVEIVRDFYESEWRWLEQLDGRQIAATWNGGRGDNLLEEKGRIGLSDEWVRRQGADDALLTTVPCMNCGVLVGRASAFRQLQAQYESLCADFYAHAPHRSRCQWLINWCLHLSGALVLLPEPVHMHAHFAHDGHALLPAGTHYRGRFLCWEGVPVLFKHNFPEGA